MMNKLTMDEAIKLVDDLYAISGIKDDDFHQNLYLKAIELVRGAGADYKYLNEVIMQLINDAKKAKAESDKKIPNNIPLHCCRKMVDYESGILNKIFADMVKEDAPTDGLNYEMLKMYSGFYGDTYTLQEIADRFHCTPKEVMSNINSVINHMVMNGNFDIIVLMCE